MSSWLTNKLSMFRVLGFVYLFQVVLGFAFIFADYLGFWTFTSFFIMLSS